MTTNQKSKKRDSEAEDAKNVASEGNNTIVIQVPREGFTVEALENLRKIVVSKETLFKKALGADYLPIVMEEDKLCFPWFIKTGVENEVDSYTRFICSICDMAKRQKRVTAKEQKIENDKFAMRVFLIRLGFIGEEYKAARKILLQNLTGNGSFKNGQRPKKAVVVTENDNGQEVPESKEVTVSESK